MILIETLPDMIKNIINLERKLKLKKESADKIKAVDLIKKGISFVRYTADNQILFAPSRFIGYKDNSIEKHSAGKPHGSVTSSRIKKILKQEPLPNAKFNREYEDFCKKYKILPHEKGNFGNERKFWDLKPSCTDVYGELEFPEGKKKYLIHLRRERSARLRQIVISRFIEKYERVFCEGCHFDFEKKYGAIGKDFIECHHIIPVKTMQKGHKTKPEDIVLLCSNCHRITHRKVEWLSLHDLKNILKKQAQKS